MNILGVNYHFEHPSIAIIANGQVIFAIEDERLTRIKHGRIYTPYKTYIPYHSIYEALKFCNMSTKDIDEIAVSYDKFLHLKNLWRYCSKNCLSSLYQEWADFRMACNFKKTLIEGIELQERWKDRIDSEDFKKIRFTEWDHHISHASSAYHCSQFSEALVVVADGSGEKAATSIYVGKKGQLKKVKQINFPHSLGFFYTEFTRFLGFEPFSDEYKVMGMAAYGENKYSQEMSNILTMKKNSYRLNMKRLHSLETIFCPARKSGEKLQQIHFDIAKSVQVHLEETIKNLIIQYLHKAKQKNLCLAGGVFQNILVNSLLSSQVGKDHIFVSPVASDAGTAIGAASLSYLTHSREKSIVCNSMFLGNTYTNEHIRQILDQANLTYSYFTEQDMIKELAKLLAEEKIIALYRGRMEFGPRALGNRSLMASPSSAKTRKKLNDLKGREQFRPLAPVVLSEDFDDYFIGHKSRYMTYTTLVKDEKKTSIPAVVHADGTARTQVISKQEDEFLYSLLQSFKEKTGIPILINTSLNVRGKPIDESPYDALASFYTSGVDYIMLGNYLVRHPKVI